MSRKKCHDILKRALDADENGQLECLDMYKEASDMLKRTLDQTKDESQKEKTRHLLANVEQRMATLIEKKSTETTTCLTGLDPNLANSILDEILFFDVEAVTFSQVIGQEEAKQVLRENVILPAIRPELFTGLRSPTQGILLYGPPGNGKTLLAKAVANESDYLLFNISASSIVSKWVGESERLMRTLFILARQLQPSIIFIDEVDSILSSRKEGEHDTSRRLKTEFLTQVDGAGSLKTDKILVMCATNRPQDLDDAVLRRLPIRVHVQNPPYSDRKKLVSSLLHNERHSLTAQDIATIARATEGYSACDMTDLARQAAMAPLREMGLMEMSQIACEQIRPLTLADFSLKKKGNNSKIDLC